MCNMNETQNTENIVLYSTGCPRCEVLKKKLTNANISFVTESDTNVMIEKGFTDVPILDVNGECMNFVEANNWINEKMTKSDDKDKN